MSIYKRKYNIKKLIEELQKLDSKTIDIDQLLELTGYDPIDVYHYYINNIRGRFRYEKNYEDKK